jgi:hypothetical protein
MAFEEADSMIVRVSTSNELQDRLLYGTLKVKTDNKVLHKNGMT